MSPPPFARRSHESRRETVEANEPVLAVALWQDLPIVKFEACGFVHEVCFSRLVDAESSGCVTEPISDVGWVDLDGRVRFDLFPQRRNSDREVQKFLLEVLDLGQIAGLAQCDLVEQTHRAVALRDLRDQRGVERVDGDSHPVQPCALTSWRGRSEGVLDNVERAQRG